MKSNENLQSKIDEALNSLDGYNRAEANHFLYEKIQYRLSIFKKESAMYNKWLVRLVCMVIVLLAVNIYYISGFTGNKNNSTKVSGLEAFAQEYNIETTGEDI